MDITSVANTIYDGLSTLRQPLVQKKVPVKFSTPYDENKVEQTSFSRKDFTDIDTSITVKKSFPPETIGYKSSSADVSKLISDGVSPAEAMQVKKATTAYAMNNLAQSNNSQQMTTQSYSV